jgi:hypothetical protein
MRADGVNGPLEPWDWRYYAEKRRKAEHDLDEAELKPYFQLDAMIEAAFDCANRLFGLEFGRSTWPLYHPDARAWEVTRNGAHMAVFIGDYFARGSKRSGAWCSAMRSQKKAGRRGAAHRGQRLQLRQGGPRAAVLRRRADAVSRVRPRAAPDAVGRDLWLDQRAPRGARFRGTAEPALRTLAGGAGGLAEHAAMPRPGRRSRRTCWTGCWPRRPTTWGSRRWNTWPRRWSISISTTGPRRPIRWRRRRRRWSGSACRAPSGCATRRRISRMSSRATAIPAGTTATCGPR